MPIHVKHWGYNSNFSLFLWFSGFRGYFYLKFPKFGDIGGIYTPRPDPPSFDTHDSISVIADFIQRTGI